MLPLDPEDRFKANCMAYSTYPTNLLSTRCPKRRLASYRRTLEDERTRLFGGSRGTLKIVEFNNGRRLPDFEASHQAELELHLQRGMEDPHLRYIAIEAPDSRSPLSCSHAMFTYLSSFHEISPSFIPAVCSFGRVLNPKDICLAYFESDDTLIVPSADQTAQRSLGRSGAAIKLSYLLRVIEWSSAQPPWNFVARPLAVYHSYDIQTGRTIWVTVKGDGNTREHVCEVLDDSLQPDPAGVRHTFEATLELHLSLLETVDENWQLYMNEIDQVIRSMGRKATYARINRFTQSAQDIQQTARLNTADITQISLVATFIQKMKSWFRRSSTKHNLANAMPAPSLSDQNSTRWRWRSRRPSHVSLAHQEDDIQQTLEKYMRMDMFSFEDSLDLHRCSETIQDAILIIKLNTNAIQGLGEFYESGTVQQTLVDRGDAMDTVIYPIKAFAAKLKNLENSLRIKRLQLESLDLVARDVKGLYDGLSQYQSIGISRAYAENARASAQRIERETSSMHMITFVTLIFLPGTFIASFLQCGVFQWKEEDTVDQAWSFRVPVFEMFMEICLAMTFITFIFWFMGFKSLQGRWQRKREAI